MDHYRLPGPLDKRGELPVAPSAPRIPRALRAFNGMPEEDEAPPPVANGQPGAARPREALTIRDLLEDPSSDEEPADEGRLARLGGALRRLRRGRAGDEEE